MSYQGIFYAIHPGNVISDTDGQRYFMSVEELMSLYGLQRDEVIVIDRINRANADFCDLIHLLPRRDGKYHKIPRDPDSQLSLWTQGISFHALDPYGVGGCCPDFSCCHPLNNPTPDVMKKRFIKAYHEKDIVSMIYMRNMFVIASYLQTSPDSIISIEGEGNVKPH